MMTKLSFSSQKTRATTHWKDEDLPLLMLYGMKRSTAKETNSSSNNMSSGHILSISIEREYDGQLVSFSLSAEKMNDFLVERTDTTARAIKPEEKASATPVVTMGETANSEVIRAISEMSQLFQVSSFSTSVYQLVSTWALSCSFLETTGCNREET
jgi:hypothetical protein